MKNTIKKHKLTITNFKISPTDILFDIIFINKDDNSKTVNNYFIHFNRNVKVYNSAIIDMFDQQFANPFNQKFMPLYDIKIDLQPDIDLHEQRKEYNQILLVDGGGLDSNAVKLLLQGYKINTCSIYNLNHMKQKIIRTNHLQKTIHLIF